ncbi:MAG: hypothetical protein DLM64_14525, partial [Solirubrobacterales bacterium]
AAREALAGAEREAALREHERDAAVARAVVLREARDREASIKEELERERTELAGEVDRSQSRAGELERELQDSQRAADVSAAQRDAAVTLLDEAHAVIASWQEQAAALEQHVATVSGQVAMADERTAALEGLAANAEDQVARLATDVDALDLQVELGERRAAALEEELSEITQVRGSLREATAERDELERQLRRLAAELSESGDQVARLRERLQAAEQAASEQEGALGEPELEGLVDDLKLRLADAESTTEAHAEERARLERHMTRLEQQLADQGGAERGEELERELGAVRARAEALLAEASAAREALATAERGAQQARREAYEREHERDGALAVLGRAHELIASSQAQAAALGRRVDGLAGALASAQERAAEVVRLGERLEVAEREASVASAASAASDHQPGLREAELQASVEDLKRRLAQTESIAEDGAQERARLERDLTSVEAQLGETLAILGVEVTRVLGAGGGTPQ